MSADNLLWDAALERLKDGNKRFVGECLETANNDMKRRQSLEGGQHPYAIILSCADSRVVPELAFDTGLGELFVIRVAGNVANQSTIASIEYAVAHLGVNLIVVMGHQSCGAITAALSGGEKASSNLEHLVSHMRPALTACDCEGDGKDLERHKDKPDFVNTVVRKNAETTAEMMASNSAIIKGEIDKGELRVLPAYYNLATGKVDFTV